MVPRIKQRYVEQLHSLAQSLEVPLVAVNIDYAIDDSHLFADYCHPIGETNELIAQGIADIVVAHEAEQKGRVRHVPTKFIIMEKIVDFVSKFYKGSNGSNTPPNDIYTMH